MFENYKNWITQEEANEILSLLPEKGRKIADRNMVVRYGSRIPYPSNVISSEIPIIFDIFRGDFNFDSVTINEYLEGQILDYHIDLLQSGNKIIILSIGADGLFSLKNPKTKEVINYTLESLSLSVLSGDYRWNWQHRVEATGRRISVVFRNSKEKLNKI